jgi:hypothetical protein
MAFRRKSKAADTPRITPTKAKNAIAVTRIVGTAVLPVITPYLTRAAGSTRDRWDRIRARRLGIPVDDLPTYSGRGGALHARIAGIATALEDVRDGGTFAATTETRLRQLTAAVRAAERMPTARRRSAHQAVAAELDRLEQEILDRLDIRPKTG